MRAVLLVYTFLILNPSIVDRKFSFSTLTGGGRDFSGWVRLLKFGGHLDSEVALDSERAREIWGFWEAFPSSGERFGAPFWGILIL